MIIANVSLKFDIQVFYLCLRCSNGSSGRVGYSGIEINPESSKCTMSDSSSGTFEDKHRLDIFGTATPF